MTIINSIYKGKRYAILLTTILTFYAPVLFAQHIADSALVEVANGQQPVSYTHLTLPTNREV